VTPATWASRGFARSRTPVAGTGDRARTAPAWRSAPGGGDARPAGAAHEPLLL